MDKKVLCPYCGAEMQKCVQYARKFYECPECFADSPSEKTGCAGPVQDWETATHLALRRYQPKNRVLTQREVLTIFNNGGPCFCYLEKQCGDICWCVLDKEQCNTVLGGPLLDLYEYGKAWRCWLRKPTEEERKAVLWDD